MRKPGIWILITLIMTSIVLIFAFSIDKVTVTASNIALTEQGWRANFSAPLKKNAYDTQQIYLTDQNGNLVEAEISLANDGRTLQVTGLEAGTYTLHVKKSAINGKIFTSLPVNKIKFTVHETLQSVNSAEELKDYFKQILAMQKKNMDDNRNMAGSREDMAMDSGAAVESEKASASDSDYSTTNNQVEGVDEGDLVKTDGDTLYALNGDGSFFIADIRDPEKMQILKKFNRNDDFYPTQLFLHKDTLVMLGEKHIRTPYGKSVDGEFDIMPIFGMTSVRFYDVSNESNPKLIREIGTDGYLNNARMTNGVLYFVTNVHPYTFWAMDTKSIDVEELLPKTFDSEKGEEIDTMDVEDIAILPGTMEPSYSVVTAIDLESPAESEVVTKGYLGGSEQLYMSENNLYLTTSVYEHNQSAGDAARIMIWNPGTANTEVYKFTLNGVDVNFHSSTAIKGGLLNQFSMDEHQGNFRVVTTEGNMWDEKNPSKNHLFIFDENLKQMGSVEGLAKGERIYSARFMGDKAYMVTFRETDPLFVIDVANPSAPKVLGELKIPGFSNYLHPLDENHLIGFGYETISEKNPNGGEPIILTQGMKISLFDVSDFANPKEKDTEIIGGRGTYSPAQYDHKALFQHRGKSLFGFPVILYEGKGNDHMIDYLGSGALVYEITPSNGIALKGDLVEKKSDGQSYEEWEQQIQRMIYSKEVLYTISMNEIKSYTLDTFKQLGSMQIN